MYKCLAHMNVCAPHTCRKHSGQKRVLGPGELEFQMVVSSPNSVENQAWMLFSAEPLQRPQGLLTIIDKNSHSLCHFKPKQWALSGSSRIWTHSSCPRVPFHHSPLLSRSYPMSTRSSKDLGFTIKCPPTVRFPSLPMRYLYPFS